VTAFAERLRARELVLGTVVTVPDPALAELVASAFDFAWIDLEHGALDIGDVPALAIGLRAGGAAALVRLPCWDTERLSPVLDAGVDGVVAPRVESPAEAEALVRRLRFPPSGSRGFGPRRDGAYGRRSPTERPLCVVQVESAAACAGAEAIAAVEGVDAIVVGTADLAYDVGRPGDAADASFRAAVEAARRGADAAGVAFGVASGDAALIGELAAPTGSVGVISVDVRLYAGAVDSARHALADAFRASAGALTTV
jgi:2-keto-3-deoxy-L-rhamnonate aldolase RhmA